jgi:hypothetical protein
VVELHSHGQNAATPSPETGSFVRITLETRKRDRK